MQLPQLAGKDIVIYDLETKYDPTIKGWRDYTAMGISVGAAYDYKTGDYNVYFDDNMQELVDRLNSAKLIVGFNQLGFDNNLLRGSGYLLKPDTELLQCDLLDVSRRSLGWAEGQRFPSGCKLDNHLEAMFGESMMKTGQGGHAFTLFTEKKMGPLTNYCLADVRRTRLFFEKVLIEGKLKTVMHGEREANIGHLIP